MTFQPYWKNIHCTGTYMQNGKRIIHIKNKLPLNFKKDALSWFDETLSHSLFGNTFMGH